MMLSYYGDDFTGSTDVMESLETHGVRTVLFARQPTDEEFARFMDFEAVGLAGTSRSQTPSWMDANLRSAFAWLKRLNAGVCHYKVCSTFDSSPQLGSIGKAIDIGREIFAQATVPLVVGAPQLKRYTAFGHLFAAYQGKVYRIDRHPVMSRHPVTPMTESDLTVHLAHQTRTPISLIGLDVLARGEPMVAAAEGIVMLDVADAITQRAAGRQLLCMTEQSGPFMVGSSGIEYALLQAWSEAGVVPGRAEFPPLPGVDRIAAVSGSCSPTTERQIRFALDHGFDGIAVDPVALAADDATSLIAQTVAQGLASLVQGRSVIVYTALGSATDRSNEIDAGNGARHRIGIALGRIIRGLIERAGLGRAILAGGDTSSHALGELGVLALTTRYPLQATPGSPLCTAHGGGRAFDGLEIAMKGGQVGHDDYFVNLRDGF